MRVRLKLGENEFEYEGGWALDGPAKEGEM
jgi:hypothetical protein